MRNTVSAKVCYNKSRKISKSKGVYDMLQNTNTNETEQPCGGRNIAFVKFPHNAAYDSELYAPAHRNALALLCYLSAMANHDAALFSGITVLRGQYASTKKRLAGALGISEREVRTAIAFLANSGYIQTAVKKNDTVGKKSRYITLFDIYSAQDPAEATAQSTARSTEQSTAHMTSNNHASRDFSDFVRPYGTAHPAAQPTAHSTYINKNKYNKNKYNNNFYVERYIDRGDVFYGDSLYDDPDKTDV